MRFTPCSLKHRWCSRDFDERVDEHYYEILEETNSILVRRALARILGLANPFDPAIGKLTKQQAQIILDNARTAEDIQAQAESLMTNALSADLERIAQMSEEDQKESLTIRLPASTEEDDLEEVWE